MKLARHAPTAVCVAAAFALSGCGGGSDDPIALSGTAASGAAIANASVSARCAEGSGSATTDAGGRYTLEIEGHLPCALRVERGSEPALHALAWGTAGKVTANITPFTELVVARLAGKSPADYYAAFGAGEGDALTSNAVDTAVAGVLSVLDASGLDTAAVGNPMTSALVAATRAGRPGDAHDAALDAYAAKLVAAKATLADMSAKMIAASPRNAGTPSAQPSVAAEVMLQPGAATCPALRSGRYVEFGTHTQAAQTIEIDAVALKITDAKGQTATLTPEAGKPCKFSDSQLQGPRFVSPAGVIVSVRSGKFAHFAFPRQRIALSELEGRWLALGRYWLSGSHYSTSRSSFSLAANGQQSDVEFCYEDEPSSCSPIPDSRTLKSDSRGGFTFGGGDVQRYAFRAGGGEMMVISSGVFEIWRRERANKVPALGVQSYWAVEMSNAAQFVQFRPWVSDVSIVERDAGSYVRRVNGKSPLGVRVNKPRAGLDSMQRFYGYPEVDVLLPMPGLGLMPETDFSALTLSVARP